MTSTKRRTSVQPPSEQPQPRAPQQERGRQRVATILDHAGAIIAAGGPGALTMHSLAKTANTSVGSLYHFFPDRESVLKSVAERHALALHEIADRLRAVPDATWRQLNAEEAIRELLLPYTDYVRRHADFVQLMRSPELAPQAQDFVKLIDRILALRLPATPTRRRRIYTEMLHAVAAGTVHLAYQLNPSKLDVWLEEVQRVLAAYLMELERCAEPVEGAEGKQAPVSRSGKRR